MRKSRCHALLEEREQEIFERMMTLERRNELRERALAVQEQKARIEILKAENRKKELDIKEAKLKNA